MRTMLKYIAATTVIGLITIADIPLLPVELVPEAQAIFGVRRRTAVIAYSAGAAHTSAAASQQQAAAAPAQQAPPPPPQQAPAPQQVSAVPVGTVVKALPGKCVPVTVSAVQYQDCEGSFYRTAFQGNNLVYVVVERPI